MSESALRDGLTRAYNKRYLTERIESELQFALRHDTPVSLIFLDIDHFKRINDVHGHQAGDHVLVQLATLAMSILGEDEVFARYGGRSSRSSRAGWRSAAAQVLSERIRVSVEAHPFVFGDATIPVTISIGVSRAPGPGIATSVDLVARADEALYAAKRAGRNRVCLAQAGAGGGHEAVKLRGRGQRAPQPRQVVAARDVHGAQVREVWRRDLRVAQREAARAQAFDQEADRRLRRVGRAMKHRLAAEETAQRDAVQPAHQRRRRPTPRRCGRARAGGARCTTSRSRRVIHVDGRSADGCAHARMTPAKSRSTVNRHPARRTLRAALR